MTFPETYDELDRWCADMRRTFVGPDLIRVFETRIDNEIDPVRLRILNIFLAREHIAQGNVPAADAIRNNDPFEEVHRWHEQWCDANPQADIIPILENAIRSESQQMKRIALRQILAEAHRRRQDYASAAAVYLDDFNERPNAPMPLISLASQKFFEEKQPDQAVRIIDQAIEVALGAGAFRRLALGMKARISLHLRNYHAVENVLKQIMDLRFTRGNFDVQPERDFLDALPPGSIDPDIERRYDEYCTRKGTSAGPTT